LTRVGALVALILAASASEDRPRPLFDGRTLAGWTVVGGKAGNWRAEGAEVVCLGLGKDWIGTNREYGDFALSLEYRLGPAGNSGVLLRSPRKGDPSFAGLEVQLLDDDAPAYRGLHPWQYTGSVYGVAAARRGAARKAGEWNSLEVRLEGSRIVVRLNGTVVLDDDLARHPEALPKHPGIGRPRGLIGLQSHGDPARFRNLAIRGLGPRAGEGSPEGLGPDPGHPSR